jgi:hypothetical protein
LSPKNEAVELNYFCFLNSARQTATQVLATTTTREFSHSFGSSSSFYLEAEIFWWKTGN